MAIFVSFFFFFSGINPSFKCAINLSLYNRMNCCKCIWMNLFVNGFWLSFHYLLLMSFWIRILSTWSNSIIDFTKSSLNFVFLVLESIFSKISFHLFDWRTVTLLIFLSCPMFSATIIRDCSKWINSSSNWLIWSRNDSIFFWY